MTERVQFLHGLGFRSQPMRRWIAGLILVVTLLCCWATPAGAFHHGWGGGWGHRGGGWGGGWGGYRGFGGGGFGYRGLGWGGYYRPWGFGYRSIGFGYPYYGGYGYGLGYPYYGVGYGGGYGGYGGGYGGYSGYYGGGYYPSSYGGYSPWYGCSNYGGYGTGATVGLGYPAYGLYSAYRPMTNIIVTTAPASSIVAPAAKPAAAPTAIATAPVTALAVQKFLGLKDIRPLSFGGAPSALASAPVPAPLRTLGDVLGRVSNVESRRKAERMLNDGDELFRAQNFHSALQKYKLAGSTAPDLAEAFWRQGHALVATHNYDLATTAFKRAVALTEDLGRGGFRLSDLYGGAAITKNQHLESLAEWATNRRNSSDPYFLLGLFLEYDGQPARAEKFFQKASDIAGISGGHIAVFLAPGEAAPIPRADHVSRPATTVPLIPVSTGTDI
jgi:tetratricopeptide (TPR) repeat protein